MKLDELRTIEQVQGFLDGSQRAIFEVASDTDVRYRFIEQTLKRFKHGSRSKREKGVLIRYLVKVSGYSRQQVTRLCRQYQQRFALVLNVAHHTTQAGSKLLDAATHLMCAGIVRI